jgi:parallel beta-helix repeat protein
VSYKYQLGFFGFQRIGFSLLLFAITVPLCSLTIVNPQSTLAQSVRSKQKFQQAQILYVNPTTGSDRPESGRERSPFKTITHALKVAPSNTVILLAPGTYSTSTGEKFPLILKEEIVIQGDPRVQGKNTIIKGNGYYSSPTAAGQNVTIVAKSQAKGIIGITAINSHKRGHGVWIESASPEITHNTFTQNDNSGVCVNGNSAPKIANNYFYRNGGNGLLVYGTSKPIVENNLFEKTGFGVSVLEKTNSLLKGNRIVGNGIGVILEGNAQATLRNNIIENSTKHGLVAIANSRADLGTSREPGGNIFRGNTKLDIQNLSNNGVITAKGNQVRGKTEGKIDLSESIASSNTSSPEASTRKTKSTSLFRGMDNSKTPSANSPNKIPVPQAPTLRSNSATTPEKIYQVIVSAKSVDEEDLIRGIYPDAFAIQYRGQFVLQIGVFNSQENAQKSLQALKDMGLQGTIIPR